jgi:hypothetical protein
MGTHDKSKAAPTHRRYGLIAAHNPQTGEMKYFISNAPANASLDAMLQAAFSRGHIEKWFERARQQAGFGAFEVRTDTSLIRHWLCSTTLSFLDRPRSGLPMPSAACWPFLGWA